MTAADRSESSANELDSRATSCLAAAGLSAIVVSLLPWFFDAFLLGALSVAAGGFFGEYLSDWLVAAVALGCVATVAAIANVRWSRALVAAAAASLGLIGVVAAIAGALRIGIFPFEQPILTISAALAVAGGTLLLVDQVSRLRRRVGSPAAQS